MRAISAGVLFVSTLTIACTSQTREKIPDVTSTNKNVETKTNTSSSAAKANENDSAVIIRPVHKYKHQKKFKIK